MDGSHADKSGHTDRPAYMCVCRYRVSLSVCATQELSLRGDNVLRIPQAARDPLSHLMASLTGMHIN